MFNKNVTNSHVAFQFLLTILNWATVSGRFWDIGIYLQLSEI
jgi:hypothetical protein